MTEQEGSVFSIFRKQVQSAIEDLKTKGRRHRQIPNLLTLMRLTAPCFIIPAAVIGNIPLVIKLTAFFGLTDLADGAIARKCNLTSELGEILDAVTDKVFASTLLIAASVSNPLLLCNLVLEGVIAGINTYKKLNNQPVKSSFIGKVKTWFLFVLAGLGIISSELNIVSIINALMASTAAMQLFTIYSYLPLTSKNKSAEINNDIDVVSMDVSNCDVESLELQKEKILEADTSVSKIQDDQDEQLEQLKAMRDFLISEQVILESNENSETNFRGYEKSKKDDFKNN